MAKSIREAMTANPCSIDADKTVAYAAKMMKDEDVGLAPIVEGDQLIGTVTDRDIAIRIVAEGKDPKKAKVREIMSKQIVTIDPQQNVEEDGKLIGVIAQADIARETEAAKTGQMVEEISQ
jgi:CBS domain-containing protein